MRRKKITKSHWRRVPNDLRDVRSKNVTNAGSRMTSGMFGPKTLPTRGPERPFRCLDFLQHIVYVYFSCIVFTSCLIYISTKYFPPEFCNNFFYKKFSTIFFLYHKDEFLQFFLSSYTFFRIFALHIFSFSIALYPPSSTAIFCQSRKLGTRAFSFVPALGPPINKFCGSNIICKTTQNFMSQNKSSLYLFYRSNLTFLFFYLLRRIYLMFQLQCSGWNLTNVPLIKFIR